MFASTETWKKAVAEDDARPLKELIDQIARDFRLPNSSLTKSESQSLENWYRFSIHKLTIQEQNRLNHYGGLEPSLRRVFPHHHWESSKFNATSKRNEQNLTLHAVEDLIPGAYLPS